MFQMAEVLWDFQGQTGGPSHFVARYRADIGGRAHDVVVAKMAEGVYVTEEHRAGGQALPYTSGKLTWEAGIFSTLDDALAYAAQQAIQWEESSRSQ